ncbi:MAG: hypothetical protein Q8R24_04415 [Legionellaceae bacterium]|nr:hypothetical protein [Legionellaceae bacterium]
MRTHTKEYMVVYNTYNGGVTWSKQRFPRKQNSFSHVTGLACVAVHSPAGVEDSQPNVYVTRDAGMNWTHQELGTPENGAAFMDLFCDDNATVCQIVGIRKKFFGRYEATQGTELRTLGCFVPRHDEYVTTG